MPRILLPDGSTRMVDALNPGDILANGQSSALDAAPTIAGEGAPSGSIAQVENPGFDADSPNTGLPVSMRITTQPRSNAPGVVPKMRPGNRSGW